MTTNINWELAPEGAVSVVQDKLELYWVNKDGQWYDYDDYSWNKSRRKHITIATRPQEQGPRKTVKDAVDYYGGVWPNIELQVICHSKIKDEWRCWREDWIGATLYYQVCTRQQFKDYVKENEVKEWTHLTNSGRKCRHIIDKPDTNGIVIMINEQGEYMRCHQDGITPIATITKEKAEELLGGKYKIDG